MAESPALAGRLLNAADPEPNADFILSGCSVWIGRIRHRANKQGKLRLCSEMKEGNHETSVCDFGFLARCL